MDGKSQESDPLLDVLKSFGKFIGIGVALLTFYYLLPVHPTMDSLVQMVKITMIVEVFLLILGYYLLKNLRKERENEK